MEADSFYDLSPVTQALYFHLNLNADDDGLVDNVRSVMRDLKAPRKSFQLLVEEGYIIELDKKIVAITHWHQHNRIKSDRYTPTTHKELMNDLRRDENDRYFKASEVICGDICAPQDSIGKDSIDKDSIDKDREVKVSTDKQSIAEHSEEEKKEEKKNISLSLSYIQDGVASLPETENAGDFLSHSSFLNAIRLYFMKKYQSLESTKFIDHYEKLAWYSGNEKITPDNYKYYVDDWMKG